VLPAHHPAATDAVVDLLGLADDPWISGTAFACAESLRAVCGVAGFTPTVRRLLLELGSPASAA
jgi:hypothetical protein